MSDGFNDIMGILCMIMGVIQIVFNEPIAAGCFWIAGAIYKTKDDVNVATGEGDSK